MKTKNFIIKVIRTNDAGVAKGEVLEARIVDGLLGIERYQILSEGPYLGEFLNWLEAIEI